MSLEKRRGFCNERTPLGPRTDVCPLAVLGVTPFGIYCKECSIPLKKVSVLGHLTKKHPSVVPNLKQSGSFQSKLKSLREKAKEMEALTADKTSFLLDVPPVKRWFCGGCSEFYSRKQSIDRHFQHPCSKCNATQAVMVSCRQTICGRFVKDSKSIVVKP